MIWIDVDVAIASAPVNIMPLIDDTDFKSIESSVAYNAAGMALKWNFTTTAGVTTQTAVTPTTSGVYDWTNLGAGMYAIEIPASGGGSINNDTEGFGWFSGVATGVLPWRGPILGFRAAALNNSLVDAGTTGLLAPTTAARTLDVTATGEAGIDWSNIGAPTTTVNLSGTSTLALEPTIAGRKLDVTTTGEAGIDWNNIGAPTTAQNLSGTTIKAVTDGVTVSTLAANVITATSIANDAITAAKVADGTIDAATFAAGAITATVIATGAIDADAIADNAIDAGAIAANAITAAKIATDAIGAAQLAADAVTEIQSGLATSASIVTLQADTDNIQTRLPTSLVSGRMDSSVGAMAADTLTASALAADAVTEIQSGLATSASITTLQSDTDDIQTRIPAALVSGRIDASVGAMAANVITAASINTGAIDADALATDAVNEIADGVWDEALAGHTTAGSAGKALSDAGAAGDPWATTLPGSYGAGTAGFIVGTNLDDTVSSRSSQSSVDTVDSNVDAIKLKTDQLVFTTSGQVDATAITVTDKLNYTTTSTDKQQSADEMLNRNLAGGASGNTRNVRNALRTLRNKVAVVAAVATVYEEDDTTPAFEADVTTTAGNPITAVEPTT